MKERYEIIKKIYPDYLIVFLKRGKEKYYGIDKKIIERFKVRKTNKIILNNLEIEKIEEYEENKYNLYYKKIKLIEMIERML